MTTNHQRGSTRERILVASYAELSDSGVLDMGAVATRAGIGRSTLYRICGDREGLREMLLLWMADIGWARAEHAVRRRHGRTRCLGLIAEYCRLTAEDPALRRGVERDPGLTLSLCTDHRRGVQPWVVARLEKLLLEHADDITLTMPVDRLAYAVVRLAESFIYSDVLAGRDVDLPALGTLVSLLLPPREAAAAHA